MDVAYGLFGVLAIVLPYRDARSFVSLIYQASSITNGNYKRVRLVIS